MVLDVLPARDPALDAGGRGVERRALGVVHVPADVDDARVLVDLGGDRRLGDLGRADVAAVQVRLVREVEQVVDEQAVAGRRAAPSRGRWCSPGESSHGARGIARRVGQGRVADPHPDERVLLDDRVGRRRGRCAGCASGRARTRRRRRVVGEAVVAADDRSPSSRLSREREAAVHAAVGQGDDLARPRSGRRRSARRRSCGRTARARSRRRRRRRTTGSWRKQSCAASAGPVIVDVVSETP